METDGLNGSKVLHDNHLIVDQKILIIALSLFDALEINSISIDRLLSMNIEKDFWKIWIKTIRFTFISTVVELNIFNLSSLTKKKTKNYSIYPNKQSETEWISTLQSN